MNDPFDSAGIPAVESGIDFEKELNAEQFAAVTAPNGPALVLAGAGSGKTRTLTYRVAYLLEQGVRPWEILLITFTNKAAREMLERVEALTGVPQHYFWGGTFHHIGQRTLRQHGEHVGLGKSFTILDQSDAESLLSDVIKKTDSTFLKNKNHPKPKVIANIISFARNTGAQVGPIVQERYPFFDTIHTQIESFSKAYQEQKLKQQVVDYDDLLELWLKLLKENPAVAEQYQSRFKHILVDEYQDTNYLQSEIIDTIASKHQIMAVGDDSQCIYTWRGANVDNILNFTQTHPGAQIYKIQTNYRSSPEILHLANSALEFQEQGYPKTLQAVREPVSKPYVIATMDAREQAQFIARRIHGLLDEGRSFSDIAVLYRAHYQAMDLQMELSRQGLPYAITSGVRFFEQAHIRDLVAQLRFAWNPHDWVGFLRVATLLPKVGPKTAERLLSQATKFAEKNNISIIQALSRDPVVAKVPELAKEDWTDLALTLENLEESLRPRLVAEEEPDLFNQNTPQEPFKPASPSEVVRLAIDGWYGEFLRNIHANWSARQDDLESLVGFAERYDNMNDFLAQLVLLNSETSNRRIEEKETSVHLTTIHQAKGLEYPVVFVIGLAENMFPLKRAVEEGDVEEERRLFYVAITRAKDELYLTSPMISAQSGPPQRLAPSRFVQELPQDSYEALKLSRHSW